MYQQQMALFLARCTAYRGADVGSDHNLVIGKIHLKLKKTTKSEVNKTYATEKLKEQTA